MPSVSVSDPEPIDSNPLADEFHQALESLDRRRVEELFRQSLAFGSPLAITERLIVPALEKIGHDWDSGRVALSQVYMSGRLCEDLVVGFRTIA